tara:strand:- start:41 stop:1270 length:1230 start_codon:yes stop_codon:yes gene_type:complete
MIVDEPIGIIELGNINIKCLIFKININNEVEILSTNTTKAEGFHNDIVVNLLKATNATRLCISEAEKKAKISLKKINVVLEQPDFLCTKFSKKKNINGSKIHKDDIDFLLKEAKKQLLLNDKKQSIIHIFNHNYIVDKKKFADEPIGVYADLLTHEITFVTVPKNNLKNINQVFVDCDIEVSRLISRIFSLGVKLLNYKELEFGSALIDLGSEKTSLGLFKNLALVHSTTIPIGINHIIKDISKVCSLSLEESENIINNMDFSFKNNLKIFEKDNNLKNTYFINSNFRKISESLILQVVKARLDEIIDNLSKQLIVPNFNLTSRINIVLTGGGSNVFNIEEYFINFFGKNLKKINTVKPEKNGNLGEQFISCFGAIKIIHEGWETEAIPEKHGKNVKKEGFFSKIFGIY